MDDRTDSEGARARQDEAWQVFGDEIVEPLFPPAPPRPKRRRHVFWLERPGEPQWLRVHSDRDVPYRHPPVSNAYAPSFADAEPLVGSQQLIDTVRAFCELMNHDGYTGPGGVLVLPGEWLADRAMMDEVHYYYGPHAMAHAEASGWIWSREVVGTHRRLYSTTMALDGVHPGTRAPVGPRKPVGAATVGRVYVVEAEGVQDRVKVGYTSGLPSDRCRSMQTGSPFPLRVYGSVPGTIATESKAHAELADCRLHGEWFNCDPSEAIEAIYRVAPT